MNIKNILSYKISEALIYAGAPTNFQAKVCTNSKAEFGDYQVNSVMSLAKKIGISPIQMAKNTVHHINFCDMISKVEIAGPGFINIFLNHSWVATKVNHTLVIPKLGICIPNIAKKTIVIDYSSPNIAKEMHVGHLRSTIIGDSVARTQDFLGHKVIRANHVGDRGTQFGMLIAYIEKMKIKKYGEIEIYDLERLYCKAKKNYEENVFFAKISKNYVVKMQKSNPYCMSIWRQLVDITMSKNQITYNRLNVTLTEKDVMGENIYNAMLPEIVSDLKEQGLAKKSEGATVVFLDEWKNKDGEKIGVIIQKKDGGYLYTTTDIACAKYRYENLCANRVLYYIDSRQHQHLMQSWNIARKAGYVPESVSLEHHMFGMMFKKNGKPFKTRDGSTVKLSTLIDKAIDRAGMIISEKKNNISSNDLQQVINSVGIGAVKYSELSKNRTTDYIFDWDNMLSFEGNTAPYIQYAYTRISSLLKNSSIYEKNKLTLPFIITENYESTLAKRLLQFEEIISTIGMNGTPHLMCTYLYVIATLFSDFYEQCKIIPVKSELLRQSRLKIALLSAQTIKIGMNILGIETIESM